MRKLGIVLAFVLLVTTAGCLTERGQREDQATIVDDPDGTFQSDRTDGGLLIAWNDDREVFGLRMTTGLDPSIYELSQEDAVGLNLQKQCKTTHQFAYNYSGWLTNVARNGGTFELRKDPDFPEDVLQQYRPINVSAHIRHVETGRRIGRCRIGPGGTTEFWIDIGDTQIHESVQQNGVRTR